MSVKKDKKNSKWSKDNIISAIPEVYTKTLHSEKVAVVLKLKKTLARIDELEKKAKFVPEDELAQAKFLKKWALLLACGGLKVVGDNGEEIDLNDLDMPVAYLMACGARTTIQMQDNQKNHKDYRISNWLLNNDFGLKSDIDYRTTHPKDTEYVASVNKKDKKNIKEGVITHVRAAATHGFSKKRKEKKTYLHAYGADGRHLGVDLALGGLDEKDIHGRDIKRDGLSGHAYLHIDKTYGDILIGSETCTDPQAPSYAEVKGQYGTHTKYGGAEKITALGSRPWGSNSLGIYSFIEQQIMGKNQEVSAFPMKRYDCLKMELNEEAIGNIIKLNPDHYSSDIVQMKPCQSVDDFQNKYSQSKHLYDCQPRDVIVDGKHLTERGWHEQVVQNSQDLVKNSKQKLGKKIPSVEIPKKYKKPLQKDWQKISLAPVVVNISEESTTEEIYQAFNTIDLNQKNEKIQKTSSQIFEKEEELVNQMQEKGKEFILISYIQEGNKTKIIWEDPNHKNNDNYNITYIIDNQTGKMKVEYANQASAYVITKPNKKNGLHATISKVENGYLCGTKTPAHTFEETILQEVPKLQETSLKERKYMLDFSNFQSPYEAKYCSMVKDNRIHGKCQNNRIGA